MPSACHHQPTKLLQAFLAELSSCEYSPHTVKIYRRILNDFFNNKAAIIGKGNKRRDIFISQCAATVLQQFMSERGRLFSVNPATIWRKFQTIILQAGFDPKIYRPHVMRHARAEHMRRSGIDPVFVAKFLGHSSVTMTAHYMSPDLTVDPSTL